MFIFKGTIWKEPVCALILSISPFPVEPLPELPPGLLAPFAAARAAFSFSAARAEARSISMSMRITVPAPPSAASALSRLRTSLA